MRKIIYIALLSLVALASCKKQEIIENPSPIIETKGKVTLNITVSDELGFGSNTKAVKAAWEEGDKLYLFINQAENTDINKVLPIIVTYDGSSWVIAEEDTDSQDNLDKIESDGEVVAIYTFGNKPAANPDEEHAYFSFGNEAYGESLSAKDNYTFADNVISIDLELKHIGVSQITINNISDASKWELIPTNGEAAFKGIESITIGFEDDKFGENTHKSLSSIKGVENSEGVAFYFSSIDNASFILHNTESDCFYYRMIESLEMEAGKAYKVKGPEINPETNELITANSWIKCPVFWYITSDYNEITINESAQSQVLGNSYDYDNGGTVVFIKNLPDGAFSNCENLTSITIPDGITSISGYAFINCNNLYSITLPESLVEIFDSAFDGCKNLSSITLPESLEYIGDYAFYACVGLESICFPKSLTVISNNAFDRCTNLSRVIFKAEEPFYFNSVFGYCNNLEDIYVPFTALNNYKNGYWEEEYKSKLKPFYPYEYTAEQMIYEYYYDYCIYSIYNDTKKKGVVFFLNDCPSYAFYYSIITSITIPEGVTKIGDSSFYKCSYLSSVTIPSSVNTIDDYAFKDCYSLVSVTIEAIEPPTLYYSGVSDNVFEDCNENLTIYVPDASIDEYKSSWDKYAEIIKGLSEKPAE